MCEINIGCYDCTVSLVSSVNQLKKELRVFFRYGQIAQLINKFMVGETNIAEEDVLAQYFRTHEVSEEWATYKEIFVFFDAGEVDIDIEAKTVEQPVNKQSHEMQMPTTVISRRAKIVVLRWAAIAVAVCMFPLLTILYKNSNIETNDVSIEFMEQEVTTQRMRLLEEADQAFMHATIRCSMDINETFSQSGVDEETDYQTNIFI